MAEKTTGRRRTLSNRVEMEGVIATESQSVGGALKHGELYKTETINVRKPRTERPHTNEKIYKTTFSSTISTSERATREFVTPRVDGKAENQNEVGNRNLFQNRHSHEYNEEHLSAKRKNKTPKNKPTLLYVIVSGRVQMSMDFVGYFAHRLGGKYKNNFKVQKNETITLKGRECTKVTLCFISKTGAIKARDALVSSNKHCDTQLLVYFEASDERGLELLNSTEKRSRLERHRKIIKDRFVQVLELHETKICLMKQEQTQLQNKLTEGKLSITEFDNIQAAAQTLEEKLEELKLQKTEFQGYTKHTYSKLDKIADSSKLDTEINKLRIEFGIECTRLNNALPIYARRSDILEAVKNHQVTVLIGETGSGKSTQITQYLLQAGYANDGLIVCTQPRKVAAVTLATRVSREMASNVGQVIGYHVGMKSKRTDLTKILYVTDHILLNECLKDNELKRFSCIIIDEAHERSIFTDLLLGMIKSAMVKRPALKIVITSATIDPDIFVSYFGGEEICPVLGVSGRTFPVEDIFCKSEDDENPFEEYVNSAIKKSLELHNTNPPEAGDILVFLISPLEVEKCCELFALQCTDDTVQCLPLHGKLKADEQAKIFLDNPPNKRKVVFATNCAETSITIPGVKFVVDTGLAKEMQYDPKRNISSLRVCPISQSSAEQRRGRAGRTAPGKCYRLYNQTVYNSMKTTSKPEILRVHLGQALLQLMDLGVNPLLFDFVEAPPQEAIDRAMQSLTDIGALVGGSITDVGRWLSKLPIEPRNAYIVKLGIEACIPIEALVVAACGGGEIFYRFGTEEEKKAADLKKLKFCHNKGDILTKLNVYREWDKIPERQRGKWCFDNSINAKSIRGVRELVNEIRTILKKEMNQDIPYVMKSPKEADLALNKILTKVLKHNVCVFLGHEKAGFYSLHSRQRVQLHPSSVLKALNLQTNIVVYENILQTSRDFITGITPVEETDMSDISPEILSSCRAAIEIMCVSLVGTFYCGKKITQKFIGPLHNNRKEVEEQLNAASTNKTTILDINRVKGQIELFSSKSDKQCSLSLLDCNMSKLMVPFKKQCLETNVGKSDDVRVVLCAGGTVNAVLMPHQFRTVLVKKKLLSADELEVCEIDSLFSSFSDIEEIKQCIPDKTRDKTKWGTITFGTYEAAQKALTLFNDSQNRYVQLYPILPKNQSSARRDFKVKISWCRRPSRGIAYVTMAWPEDFVRAMQRNTVVIKGSLISINCARSKGGHDTTNQLFLKGFPFDITEADIKSSIANLVDIPNNEIESKVKNVVVPRETVETSTVMYNAMYENIEQEALKYASRSAFNISFLPDPRENPKCVRYNVIISFSHTEDGIAALNGMKNSPPSLGGIFAQITAELETSIGIRKNILISIEDDLDCTIQSIASTFSNVCVKINTSKAGNIFLNIKANDPNELARVKVLIHAILQGDTLECGRSNEVSRLFTKDGRAAMRDIEQKIGSVIFVDSRTMTVTVHGTEERRTRSLLLINEYLDKLAGLTERVILLKGDDKPEGLMKEIMLNFVEKIKTLPGIKSLDFRYLEQQMTILGDKTTILETEKLVIEASERLQKNTTQKAPDIPDCSVCFCPIEPNDMYRIECCGHPYCKECIKQQIKSAIQHKTFPVVCASENCGQTLVIEDFNALIREGCTTQSHLVKASISDFIGRNKSSHHYCITPDCDMIYEITSSGLPFTCGQCHETMCTSCHIQYHNGVTCSMYRAERKEENKIELWLRKDPDNRKLCPKCRTPIEKIEGCNHMTCESCHIHICWVCLETFKSGQDCYGHLQKVHHSYV